MLTIIRNDNLIKFEAPILVGPMGPGGAWGTITGVITNQVDLIAYGTAHYQPIGPYITLTSLSAGTGISYNSTSGLITNILPFIDAPSDGNNYDRKNGAWAIAGSSMVWPGTAGIAVYSGASSWSTSIHGTSSQFVKGDGSVDTSAYITLASLSATNPITYTTGAFGWTNSNNYITLTSLSAGTGISYNGTTGVITNSAPDKTVAFTGGTNVTIEGTYPNFTITDNSQVSSAILTALAGLTYGTLAFVKMTGANTFGLDTSAYMTGVTANAPLSGAGTSGSHLTISTSGTWSGTAANVTTNANLTGPITSVGNATSVAAQTGTGSTFVMSNSPVLVSPALGTPASGTMTNVTGTAANLTAGYVLNGGGGMIYPSGTGITIISSGTSWGTTIAAPTGIVVGTSDTQTLTNKRIPKRTGTIASSGTLSINTDLYDRYTVTALATNILNVIPSGSPLDGDKLELRFYGTAAQTLAWGTGIVSRSPLPVTTIGTKYLYVGLEYNSQAVLWDCIASVEE
jgi:hypothetical protein